MIYYCVLSGGNITFLIHVSHISILVFIHVGSLRLPSEGFVLGNIRLCHGEMPVSCTGDAEVCAGWGQGVLATGCSDCLLMIVSRG